MERTAFTIYLAVLVLSPLLFGSVHTYAYTLVILLILTGSLLLVFHNIVRSPPDNVFFYGCPVTSLNLLFLLVLASLVFQVIPWPGFLVGILSPESVLIAKKSMPASLTAIGQDSIPNTLSLAPYRYPVRMSIVRWIAYGLFFLGFTQALRTRKRIEIAIGCILAIACFSSLYGIFQTYSGSNQIWWFTKTAYVEDVTGTYINRNHFAFFMGLALILSVAYSGGLSVGSGQKEHRGFKVMMNRFLSNEQAFSKKMLVATSGVVIGLGLVLSASRGGILAATAGLFLMGLFFVSKKKQRRNGVIVLIIFGFICLFSLYIGAERSWERFRDINASYAIRTRYAETTLDLFNDFKLFGVGVGNFRYAYPKYQQAQDTYVLIEHAHNDWAQFLAEAGIIGFSLFLFSILFYLYKTIRKWKGRDEPFMVLGFLPLVALLSAGVHSYSDFNLHIPANFLTLTAIVAIGHGVFSLDNETAEDSLFRLQFFSLKRTGFFFLFFSLFLIFWAGWWSIRHFIAETHCNTVRNTTLNRDPYPSVDEIRKAIFWQPGNASYSYKLAQALMKGRKAESVQETYAGDIGIINALENSVRLNPLQATYHLKLGREYFDQPVPSDKKENWRTAADISMERGAFFIGERSPWQCKELGDYWVMRSKTFPPSSISRENALVVAQKHYRKAILAQGDHGKPRLLQEIEKTVKNNYPMAEEQTPFESGFLKSIF